MGSVEYLIAEIDNEKESGTQYTWHTNARKF